MGARFSVQERAGFVVLALVVVAVIAWLALGPGPERHGGLTRVQAERRMAQSQVPSRCRQVRDVRCHAAPAGWRCVARMTDGSGSEADVDATEGPVAVVSFDC
jgi:hypothetical protein